MESNKLGRIARDGRITKFILPIEDSGPAGIVGTNTGQLVVALFYEHKIATTFLAAAEPTPPPASMPTVTRTVPPGSTATPTFPLLFGCRGDCNGEGRVTINELIAAVKIALVSGPYDACINADADHDGSIQINDLVAAVNSALQGCPE